MPRKRETPEQNPKITVDEDELPQTDPELEDLRHDEVLSRQDLVAEGPNPQTDIDDNADEQDIGPLASSALKRPRKSRTNSQSDSDAGTDNADEPEHTDISQTGTETTKQPRRRGTRKDSVVAIDEQRTVETQRDKQRSDLLDLVESLKGKRILTNTIQGVERSPDNPDLSYAVIYHGDFKVIIPAEELVEPPDDFRGRLPGDVMHYLITKRLGAEVDYIIKGVDAESGVAAASRLEAMAAKRREYYFKTDRNGNYQLYEGARAEARIVSVIRSGVFVDLFGAEVYIPLVELSYQRWMDATQYFQSGQRVLVKLIEVDRSDRANLIVKASVKQAARNPYEQALKRFVVGNRYVGTVSLVDVNGVFVSMDGGIDCLCSHPKRGRPPRGARVTVRILGINTETNRIWGVITHMSLPR